MDWPLGRVIEVFSDVEGCVRLSKYDIVLKNHLNDVIKRSKISNAKVTKNRARNFITFISKTTINMLIKITIQNIKKAITDQVKNSYVFV